MLLAGRHVVRLGAVTALVAVLTAFLAAVWWWGYQSRAQAGYGVTGASTVLTAPSDDLRPPAPGAMRALREYLNRHDLPLLVVCVGDTRPGVVVLGPTHRVSWLRGQVPPGAALLVRGSYTAERWAQRRSLPGFVPRGVHVAGLTLGPPKQHYLQFVMGSVAQFPAADYVVGTSDPDELAEFTRLLAAAGAPASRPAQAPATSLWRDPTFVVTSTTLLCALGCLALDWSVLSARLLPRWQVARRHGASQGALLRKALGAAAPAVVVGAAAGASVTLLAPLADDVDARHLPFVAWPVMALAAAVLVGTVWGGVVLVTTQVAVRRAD